MIWWDPGSKLTIKAIYFANHRAGLYVVAFYVLSDLYLAIWVACTMYVRTYKLAIACVTITIKPLYLAQTYAVMV